MLTGAPEEIRTPDPQIRSLVRGGISCPSTAICWAAGYEAAHDNVVALHFALVSVQAGRDTDVTLGYARKAKTLKLLALPRGLEPLFSP